MSQDRHITRACGSRGSGCTSLGQSGCGTHSLCRCACGSVLHRSSSSHGHTLPRASSALRVPACSRLHCTCRAGRNGDSIAPACALRGRRDVCMLYLHACAGLDDPSNDSCVCPVRGRPTYIFPDAAPSVRADGRALPLWSLYCWYCAGAIPT